MSNYNNMILQYSVQLNNMIVDNFEKFSILFDNCIRLSQLDHKLLFKGLYLPKSVIYDLGL